MKKVSRLDILLVILLTLSFVLSSFASANTNTDTVKSLVLVVNPYDETTLEWSSFESAIGYYVYRTEQAGAYGKGAVNDFAITGRSFWDKTAIDGITYYYTVKPIMPNGSIGQPSNEVKVHFVSDVKKTISLQINNAKITVNGKPKNIDAVGTKPIIQNGRTLMPVRAVIEEVGGKLLWDEATKKMTTSYRDKIIEMWVGKKVLVVNGVKKDMSVAPQIVNGKILLPIKYITENIGFESTWNAKTGVLTIIKPSGSSEIVSAPSPTQEVIFSPPVAVVQPSPTVPPQTAAPVTAAPTQPVTAPPQTAAPVTAAPVTAAPTQPVTTAAPVPVTTALPAPQVVALKFQFPIDGTIKINQGFGENPVFYAQYGQKGHNGLDLNAPLKTPVKAAADGKIFFEGYGKNSSMMGDIAGICCIIDHGDVYTGYAHLSSTIINNGDVVKKGQIIGYSGSTGVSTGPHLHFEFIGKPTDWNNGYAGRVNPNSFLSNSIVTTPSQTPVPSVAGTYKQILYPNAQASCRSGWCLEYVQNTFGVPKVGDSASDYWYNHSNYKHADKNFPANCYVPIWFSTKNLEFGHVALLCPDGKVWSASDGTGNGEYISPRLHTSIDDLIRFYSTGSYPLTYLGWTEDVGGVKVVSPD